MRCVWIATVFLKSRVMILDDRLFSLVLMLENALKTRLQFAIQQHLRVVAKLDYIVSSEAGEKDIDAKKRAMMGSIEEVLEVLSILDNWATEALDELRDGAWEALGLGMTASQPSIASTNDDCTVSTQGSYN